MAMPTATSAWIASRTRVACSTPSRPAGFQAQEQGAQCRDADRERNLLGGGQDTATRTG